MAIALANAKLYYLAITDGLTGLYSKRHLLNKLEMLAARHESHPRETFFLLMLDIDFFKKVNDTYGHEIGDQVLIQLAELIRKNLRLADTAFRYGGEEFVILVPGDQDDVTLGLKIAERLRGKVEEHVFDFADFPASPSLRQSISVGVACFPRHGATPHGIIQAADEALYEAKAKGRNQVCCAPDR